MAPAPETRNIPWRAAVRLVLVGASPEERCASPTSMRKKVALAELSRLCGPHCPPEKDLGDQYRAFAHIVQSYTGEATTAEEARKMFVNERKRGYTHTPAFRAKLGDRPWPPNADRPDQAQSAPLPEEPETAGGADWAWKSDDLLALDDLLDWEAEALDDLLDCEAEGLRPGADLMDWEDVEPEWDRFEAFCRRERL